MSLINLFTDTLSLILRALTLIADPVLAVLVQFWFFIEPEALFLWDVVKWPLLVFWLFKQCWTIFAATMNAVRVRNMGKATKQVRFMAYANLPEGLILDFCLMWIFCIVLWERPKDWLLSGKLWRLSQDPAEQAWRRERAEWWRAHFLDWLDSRGMHSG